MIVKLPKDKLHSIRADYVFMFAFNDSPTPEFMKEVPDSGVLIRLDRPSTKLPDKPDSRSDSEKEQDRRLTFADLSVQLEEVISWIGYRPVFNSLSIDLESLLDCMRLPDMVESDLEEDQDEHIQYAKLLIKHQDALVGLLKLKFEHLDSLYITILY